jgi:PAS domain S-box-containing protein
MVEPRRDIILILEDDAGTARLQQRHLERAGYAVILAATPDEALGHLKRGGISLIVLDYHLGGEMTGLEFCARLKSMGYDLPLVMVSGSASESTIIQALRVGVREFIPKTKDFLDDLPQAVGKVLERTRLEMQLSGAAQTVGKGGLVLIVEDDESTALLQRRQLERAGYVVVTATNAREAIQHVTQGDIALMLLDQNLSGGETGLDLYRHLKSIGHDLPTIMVTGYSDEAIAIEALRAGVRDFVVKTTDYLNYLAKAVEEVFARVALESQILESRARLASIIGSALDAIITVESDLHITMFNAAAERVFGCPADEAIGQSIHRFIRDFPVTQAKGADESEAGAGSAVALSSPLRYETLGICADGRECPLEVSVVQSELMGRTFYTITARDITERKQAEREREQLLANERALRAQAEQASRLKDEFLATVSHELRTPLNSMLGWTRLMRTGHLDAGEMVRAVETVERNAVAQTKLVNDLLDMSRIVSGKFQLNLEPVKLSTVIEAAIEVLRPTAEAKQIQTRTSLNPGIGLLLADPTRLQQIVWNLLSNAIKFTPEGGQVEVGLAQASSEARITVRDTGMGIGADFLPHVFDPFRQADGSISRRQGGLGLGLAIVRHLVELHGGEIEAASPGPGRGSTFTVKLPLQEPRAQMVEPVFQDSDASALLDRSPNALLAGLRILIVDDQDDARELIEVLLTQYGAEVSAAQSAQEALDLFDKVTFDLLVSDIGMPDKDGYWLIHQVRRRGEHGKHIPAIALTAFASKEDRIHILAAGYQMHVPKPVEPDELATVAASLAGRMGRNALNG